MAPMLQDIETDKLSAHPDNPRLLMREDVVESIASHLREDGFSKAHALLVRPLDDKYQILAGHHRWKAAMRAGVDAIPCWVEDMGDDQAFMTLARSNMQGELSPLEIGMHAFKAVPPTASGRAGEGIGSYARSLGKTQPYLSQLWNAASVIDEVYKSANNVPLNSLVKKAQHLYEISQVPEKSIWEYLVEKMVTGEWTVNETEKQCNAITEFISVVPRNKWIPLDEALDAYFYKPQRLSLAKLNNLLTAVSKVRLYLEENGSDADSASFEGWLEAVSGGDSWDRRAIVNWLEAFQAKAQKAKKDARQESPIPRDEFTPVENHFADAVTDDSSVPDFVPDEIENEGHQFPQLISSNWFQGKWQDYIEKLDDGEVGLLLTDPPYGMNYRSNMRKTKHEFIEGDDESAFQGVQDMLEAMYPKLCDNAHVLVFCGWRGEPKMREAVLNAGYEIRGSLIWSKDQALGMGDLEGSFAPSHERILHAVKGKPVLSRRIPDVLNFPRESSDRHPTEKPLSLLKTLCEVASVEDQVVCDPYGGVASTCVAAKETGRRWWGTEMAEKYWEIGDQRLLA